MTKLKRQVAIIGSSGGGTATLGHTDGPNLIDTIRDHLQSCHMELAYCCFVALDRGKGMDYVNAQHDTAILYSLKGTICTSQTRGTLEEVNNYIGLEGLDEKLARQIRTGTVQALICISCSPKLFTKTLLAAAAQQIPVTGSGGSSLSYAASVYRVHLVGNAGGSVATSTVTRAISYTYALAHYWGLHYRPWTHDEENGNYGSAAVNDASFTSVLNSCLPIFWGTCLMKALLKVFLTAMRNGQALPFSNTFIFSTVSSIDETIIALETRVIPTTCAVIMAISSSSSTSASSSNNATRAPLIDVTPHNTLTMAAIIAASTSTKSLLSGFLAGWLVKQWTKKVLFQCIVWNIPATMAGLVSSAGTGAVIGIGLLPIKGILQIITATLRTTIHWSVSFRSPYLRGFSGLVWGLFCCYASKVGWYHSIILPIILVEMELGDPSFVGSVDELTLVLVCAGVCAGYLCSTIIVSSKHDLDRNNNAVTAAAANISICRRGLRINLLYGDFVEACYPFMESAQWVNVAGYVASGGSVAIMVILHGSDQVDIQPAATMAYLPYPVALVLSGRDARTFAVASLCAFGIPFLATTLYFTLPNKMSKLHL